MMGVKNVDDFAQSRENIVDGMERARNALAGGLRSAQLFAVGEVYPVVRGRLAFSVHSSLKMTKAAIRQRPDLFFCSSDIHERYESFCSDFGPVNLAAVHGFVEFMNELMEHPELRGRTIVYYAEEDSELRTNACFLLCAYLVIERGYSPEDAWEPFAAIMGDPFLTFRDASYHPQDYFLTVLACCQGIKKAMSLGWYSPDKFIAEHYEVLDDPAIADLHRVCPKFVAFKGPSEFKKELIKGVYTFPPKHYCEIFQAMGVGAVVRLNEASTYDAKGFTKNGVRHYDLEFPDNNVPPEPVVRRFLEICEAEGGSVGVHCKAGLGRTGTLIAVYWMKHFGMTASECIGWLRIVRPGSVIGPQQAWLHWAEGVYGAGCGGGVSQGPAPCELTAEDNAAIDGC